MLSQAKVCGKIVITKKYKIKIFMKEKFSDKLLRLSTNNFGALVIVLLLTVATAFASYDEINAVWFTFFAGLCWAIAHGVISAIVSGKKINLAERVIIYTIAVLLPTVGLLFFL